MLFQHEEEFLKKIPKSKKVKIGPFSKKATAIAERIIRTINEVAPDLKVVHIGAAALGISGQKELDIYALSRPEQFFKYLSVLVSLFGRPKSQKKDSTAWEFNQGGYEIELYLTDPKSPSMRKQLAVFKTLKNNKALLKEYERPKEKMGGKSLRSYQGEKYEFYHRILNSN